VVLCKAGPMGCSGQLAEFLELFECDAELPEDFEE